MSHKPKKGLAVWTISYLCTKRHHEVATGTTGHIEPLMVEFDTETVTLKHLLFEFFRNKNSKISISLCWHMIY
jgi:peptide methionine sulfoxide reductase MsrA